jgi:hypothetical protein
MNTNTLEQVNSSLELAVKDVIRDMGQVAGPELEPLLNMLPFNDQVEMVYRVLKEFSDPDQPDKMEVTKAWLAILRNYMRVQLVVRLCKMWEKTCHCCSDCGRAVENGTQCVECNQQVAAE